MRTYIATALFTIITIMSYPTWSESYRITLADINNEAAEERAYIYGGSIIIASFVLAVGIFFNGRNR